MIPTWLIWFAAGIILAFLELVLPIFVVLFFGFGCLVVSAVLLIGFDLTVAQQILVFLVASISSLILLRQWMIRVFKGVISDRPEDEFDDQPIGKVVRVIGPIVPPRAGRIEYRGTQWDAYCDESIEPGMNAEITGRVGTSRQAFHVKKVP